MMVNGGTYKKGTIILKSGQVITAKDLIAAKKEGIAPEHLAAYLEGKNPVSVKEVTQPTKQEPLTAWATVPRSEIAAIGLSKRKDEARVPWYKKILGKVVSQ